MNQNEQQNGLHAQIMNLPCKPPYEAGEQLAARVVYREGHRDARHAAAELVASASDPVGELPSVYEQRLRAVLDVVNRYLPPDGIAVDLAMSEIIGLVDPWPGGASPLPQSVGEPVATVIVKGDFTNDDFYWKDAGVLLDLRPGEYDLCFASTLPQEPREAALYAELLEALQAAEIGLANAKSYEALPSLEQASVVKALHRVRATIARTERELRGAQEVKAGEDWQDIPDAVIAGILRFAWKREPTLREITSAAKAAHPSDSRGEKG